MQLFHFDKAPNFGDALNPWLWPRLLGPRLQERSPTLFLGIGTILSEDLPAADRYAVLGAGGGYGPFPRTDRRWRFYAVRGPLTAKSLGLPPERAAIDAAYLLRRTTLPAATAPDGPRIGFMPHWQTRLRVPWPRICELSGLRYLDPARPVDELLAGLRACDAVIAEAMHAAIVADALRVRWLPVRLGEQFLEFKWRDWLESVELDCTLQPLPAVRPVVEFRRGEPLWRRSWRRTANAAAMAAQAATLVARLRKLRRRLERDSAFGYLSRDAVMRRRLGRLEQGLEELLAAET